MKSAYDLRTVADLVRMHGVLGRVAGLLKVWLAKGPGHGFQRVEGNEMMGQFRALQAEILRLISRATK